MGFQDLVSIAPWTIIAQLCNLLIQAYLFKRFLFRPVQNIIAKRQEEINKTYDDAQKAQADADAAKASLEASLSEARGTAAEIIKKSETAAQAQAERIVSEAREEADALRERADAEIASERRRAMREMKNDISGIAVDIAGKVAEKEIDGEKHRELIQDFIDSLGDAS